MEKSWQFGRWSVDLDLFAPICLGFGFQIVNGSAWVGLPFLLILRAGR
jgi:hypothetical protein